MLLDGILSCIALQNLNTSLAVPISPFWSMNLKKDYLQAPASQLWSHLSYHCYNRRWAGKELYYVLAGYTPWYLVGFHFWWEDAIIRMFILSFLAIICSFCFQCLLSQPSAAPSAVCVFHPLIHHLFSPLSSIHPCFSFPCSSLFLFVPYLFREPEMNIIFTLWKFLHFSI